MLRVQHPGAVGPRRVLRREGRGGDRELDPAEDPPEDQLAQHEVSSYYGDHGIQRENTCQLNDVKMTRRGLLHKGLTSAGYNENLEAFIKKQPKIDYASV